MSWPRHVPATWSPFFGAPSLSSPSLPPPRPSFSALEEERERKTPEKEGGLRVVRAARASYVAPLPFFRPFFPPVPLFFLSELGGTSRLAPAALVILRISHRRNGESVASRPICAKISDSAPTFADSKTVVFQRLLRVSEQGLERDQWEVFTSNEKIGNSCSKTIIYFLSL